MSKYFRYALIFVFLSLQLFARPVETFYGTFEIKEPVILDLIDSPAFQRLKQVRQYGVAYYISHTEEYSRYDHSLGVFAILRKHGASLDEQIAGLLHDVSHTAFSHVGDWVYEKVGAKVDYQTSVLKSFFSTYGIEKILRKHKLTTNQVDMNTTPFLMLKQSLPSLCADRIDYNIQGAYFQNFITKEEAQALFEDLNYQDGSWTLSNIELASKIMRFSLHMTKECWTSLKNHLTCKWLAEALNHAFKINLLSKQEFHFGTDDTIWKLLQKSKDPVIAQKIEMILHADDYFEHVEPNKADEMIPFKSRGIDPWIRQNGKLIRLSSLKPDLGREYQEVKELAKRGWALKYLTPKSSQPTSLLSKHFES